MKSERPRNALLAKAPGGAGEPRLAVGTLVTTAFDVAREDRVIGMVQPSRRCGADPVKIECLHSQRGMLLLVLRGDPREAVGLAPMDGDDGEWRNLLDQCKTTLMAEMARSGRPTVLP